ncbi:aspartyl/asparaginyl beta-hydroxylase domain-containing protein [Nonomuraea cavernae]|uniref:aspartyl/asparaginyl beta-hydroxylase domain-containing protein n=1 Tax=Nonomuraea cavernae TaxID=2045107 RepID=UPI0033D17EFE
MSMVAALDAVQLRSGYDVERLERDLEKASRLTWGVKTWYSSEDGPGAPAAPGWKCLPVRSPGGDVSRTDPGGPGTVDFVYTPIIDHLPYVQSVIREVPGNHRAIEFLALAPGACSPVHTDYPSGFAFGWVRLHVPIITNPQCSITINGNRHYWEPGTLWYGDVSQPHHVANESDTTRVHLVIDVEVSPEMVRIFPDSFLRALGDDRILHNRPEVPLPAGHGLNCVFRVPAGECLTTIEPWRSSPGDDCVVTLTPAPDGRLALSTSDGFQATLVHVGDDTFRYLGWTDTHTLTIGRAVGNPPAIVWRFREGSRLVAETELTGRWSCLP